MVTRKTFFKQGKYLVTSVVFKSIKRDYRISSIQAVDNTRPHFWLLLPLLAGVLRMTWYSYELLYIHEIIISIAAVFVLCVSAWFTGILKLKGKYIDGIAAFGSFKKMNALRDAIREALAETDQLHDSHYHHY